LTLYFFSEQFTEFDKNVFGDDDVYVKIVIFIQ